MTPACHASTAGAATAADSMSSVTAVPSATTTMGADSDGDEQVEGDSAWLLPKSIDIKSTTLCGVAPQDRLFSPLPGARVISAIPGFGGHVINHERTAIAYTMVGEGSVCFVGDVNAEVKTM